MIPTEIQAKLDEINYALKSAGILADDQHPCATVAHYNEKPKYWDDEEDGDFFHWSIADEWWCEFYRTHEDALADVPRWAEAYREGYRDGSRSPT